MDAYTENELAAYERGRRAGLVAGRIQGISETITAMTQAGRQLARVAQQAKPKRKPLKVTDLIGALMEGT